MAIKGLSLAEKEKFILPADPGHEDHEDYKKAVKAGNKPETPTTFLIGNLTQASRVEIGDITMTPTIANSGVSMSMQRMKKTYMLVQRGLKGWDNLTDPDEETKQLIFEEETIKDASGNTVAVPTEKCLLYLDTPIMLALAAAISEKNGMTAAIEKNLDGASPQSLEQLLTGGIVADAPKTSKPKEDA